MSHLAYLKYNTRGQLLTSQIEHTKGISQNVPIHSPFDINNDIAVTSTQSILLEESDRPRPLAARPLQDRHRQLGQ